MGYTVLLFIPKLRLIGCYTFLPLVKSYVFFFISFTRHEVELSREAGQTWSLSDGTRIAHYIRDISEIPFRIGRAHCSHAGLLGLNLLPFRCPEPLVIVPKPIGFMLMASIAISPKTASHSSTHQPRSFRPRTNLSQTLSQMGAVADSIYTSTS